MNINQYNPIKTINMEALNAEVSKVASGSGTYEALIKDVVAGKVKAVTDGSGNIIGMYYDTNKTSIEDEIEGRKFARAYSGKDVMTACHLGWSMIAERVDMVSIVEEGSYAEVTLSSGEVKTIGQKPYHAEPKSEAKTDSSLPEEVRISYTDISSEEVANVKAYLRHTYGYCLEKGASEDISYKWGDESVLVSNLKWGRKLTESERAGWASRR